MKYIIKTQEFKFFLRVFFSLSRCHVLKKNNHFDFFVKEKSASMVLFHKFSK